MANEFLTAGISVAIDMNAMRVSQRRAMRELARKNKAAVLVVWFQVDPDTAFIRNIKRDRRKLDDRYAVGYEEEQFRQLASYMQNPEPIEDQIVVSGKHTFVSQMSGVMKKLSDMKVIKSTAASKKMIRPDLVNHIPQKQPEPSKHERRNIVLR
jgi:predicted kinase